MFSALLFGLLDALQLLLVPPRLLYHRIDLTQVKSHLLDGKILLLDALQQGPLVFLAPLLLFGHGCIEHLLRSTLLLLRFLQGDQLQLALLQRLSDELGPFDLAEQLLGLQLASLRNFTALFDGARELLDIIYGLLILLIDFLYNFERSVRLAEDSVRLLTRILLGLLLDLHAVVSPFSALHVELDVALGLAAFDRGADLYALATAYDAADRELREVQAVHFDGCLGRDLRAGRPQRARVVHPIIQTVSDGRRAG